MDQLASFINGRIVIRDCTNMILLIVYNNEVVSSSSTLHTDILNLYDNTTRHFSPSDALSRLILSYPIGLSLTIESVHNNTLFESSCNVFTLISELLLHLHVHTK